MAQRGYVTGQILEVNGGNTYHEVASHGALRVVTTYPSTIMLSPSMIP
jgi:hypothetical protein